MLPLLLLVRVKGLEPSQSCPHKNLNLTRLPIPPNPQVALRGEHWNYTTRRGKCQGLFEKIFKSLQKYLKEPQETVLLRLF